MFKTKLMTAAAVMTLTAAGLTGAAHAQTTPDLSTSPSGAVVDSNIPGNSPATDTSVPTPLDGAQPGGAMASADGTAAVTEPVPADTGISEVASSEPMAPVRSKAENNRMSRKAENKITADLNQDQLEGLPSNSLAASTDTGLRTTDNSSVAAGSMASPTPSTATGDTVAPTDDSTLPPSQTGTPTLPNSTVEQMPDEGKPGANTNPTDATDTPEVQ